MVGTIFGLGLSQQFNGSGEPYVGCKLYIYEAGSSTPVTVYKDFSLTSGNEHQHPIVADSLGRIPAFWLNDGSYRVRLTDADGNELFDEDSLAALGDSSTTITTSSVPNEALLKTGDMIATYDSGSRTGWVRCNGNTIGNAASAASERANSDTEALFTFLWNNIADSEAPVSTGRGASASADFDANKTIQLPDHRGRVFVGLDTMGNTAADRVAAAITNAVAGGVEDFNMTEGQLPVHTHAAGSLTVASHTHSGGTYVATHSHSAGSLAVDSHTHGAGSIYAPSVVYNITQELAPNSPNDDNYCRNFSDGNVTCLGTSAASAPGVNGSTASASPSVTGNSGAATPAVEGSSASTGSGDSISLVQPYIAGYWFIKL